MTDLITIHRKHPFTNTLAIAEGVGIPHKNVFALIRKHQKAFEELHPIAFQTRKGEALPQGGFGKSTRFALLTEDQATFLMTLFRNSEAVLQFKLRLVKAFRAAINEIERLRKQSSDPDWRLVRDESKLGYRWMSETLQESREAVGKKTQSYHYSNEARLVRSVLKNRIGNRDDLTADELKLVGDLQRYNATLISRGLPYQERKELLIDRSSKRLVAA